VKCPALEQPMLKVPELTRDPSTNSLQAVLTVSDQERVIWFNTATPIFCASQHLRYFSGYSVVHPEERWPATNEPLPGPTLRARVGDTVQITFLNQINVKNLPDSQYWDRDACDNVIGVYPSNGATINDTYPNCFHGSSTANVHFHGTHTSPSSTGDNVLLQIRPSPRLNGGKGGPAVTEASVHAAFRTFFQQCRAKIATVPSQWPYVWKNLPLTYREKQKELLEAYDAKNPSEMLWHQNEKAIDAGAWPQYYIGAYPICYQLPEYKRPAGSNEELHMGQSPGTQWYHMHKHGSTTLNINNGLIGAFIIEGKYDDQLNAFYKTTADHKNWDLRQQVMVIQELGVQPKMEHNQGPGARPFSVNGRREPTVAMRPGEVQMWRIVNGSSRSGAYFVAPAAAGLQWVQIAQDGVQLNVANYAPPAAGAPGSDFMMAAGNRVDLLVRVPKDTPAGTKIPIKVVNVVEPTERPGGSNPNPADTLFSVVVDATNPPEPEMGFITKNEFPTFPEYLADIDPATIHLRRELTFHSGPRSKGANHTINGKKFGDVIDQSMLLNTNEEWKIINTSSNDKNASQAPIMHPFHIHINPFQVVEVFDPWDARYVFDQTTFDDTKVCNINTKDPSTWHACKLTALSPPFVWWDTFAMPAGKQVNGVVIPGYFRMRSDFADYTGQYVLHCHILAHEDRGMMELIEVVPNESIWKHH
jgi:FtsP/CotA-like multicopper oxidase with cupredoxin domain